MGVNMGGRVSEGGHFPEVCKKSFQAMVSDMQAGITPEFFERFGFNELHALTPGQLEMSGSVGSPLFAARGESHYRVISWDEALDMLSSRLKQAGPTRS